MNADCGYTVTVGCPSRDDDGDYLCACEHEIPVLLDTDGFSEFADRVGLQTALMTGPSGRLGTLPTRCDACDREYTEAEATDMAREAKHELVEKLRDIAEDLERARRQRIA